MLQVHIIKIFKKNYEVLKSTLKLYIETFLAASGSRDEKLSHNIVNAITNYSEYNFAELC